MKLWVVGLLLVIAGCANTESNTSKNTSDKADTHQDVCRVLEKDIKRPKNALPRRLDEGLTAKRVEFINDDFTCHINMVIEIDDDLLMYPRMEGNSRAEKVAFLNSPKGQLTVFDGFHAGIVESMFADRPHWIDIQGLKFSLQVDYTSGDAHTTVINTLDNTGFDASESCYSKFIAVDLCAYVEEEALLTQKDDLYNIQNNVILEKVSSSGKALTLEYAYLPEFDYVLDGTNVQRQKISASGLKKLEREVCGKQGPNRGFVKAGGEVKLIFKSTKHQLNYSSNELTCSPD
ncbi:hypothetical protein [Enterovibrio baiacu]|uniref:hypothetical protein n=1 Tax=Enterovibrio baiacu TaxID=2491023 RepID=UPI00101332F0|nr:hypothetical protein [Enterovibrio baiacu]MBE1276789.1 hypothetical protein [Enterovibrio baiacu]